MPGQNSGTEVKVWDGAGFPIPGQTVAEGWDKRRAAVAGKQAAPLTGKGLRGRHCAVRVAIVFYVLQAALL